MVWKNILCLRDQTIV